MHFASTITPNYMHSYNHENNYDKLWGMQDTPSPADQILLWMRPRWRWRPCSVLLPTWRLKHDDNDEHHYLDVTTLHSGLFLSQVRLSSDCLSVCNVGVPYSGGLTFRQYFFTALYFTEIVPGNPRPGALDARGVAK